MLKLRVSRFLWWKSVLRLLLLAKVISEGEPVEYIHISDLLILGFRHLDSQRTQFKGCTFY